MYLSLVEFGCIPLTVWFGSVALTVISFLSVLLTAEPQEKAANEEDSQVKLE